MFRTQYDNDITVWSPQGRIHQIEYAMEAVKQGSAAVGVKSKTHAVLATLKRAPSELSEHQRKIFQIDSHIGIGIAGLTSDGRSLCSFLQSECLAHRWAYEEALPLSRLMSSLGLKLQTSTQRWGRRPFGVGLIVVGADDQGPHVYQVMPNAMTYDCKGMAIGARSQSARTYLEKHLDDIQGAADLDALVHHALQALQDCLPNDTELSVQNTEIAVVGLDRKFSSLSDEEIQRHVARLDKDDRPAVPEQEPALAPAVDEAPEDVAEGEEEAPAGMNVD